jgi:serine/threonine protein kinase
MGEVFLAEDAVLGRSIALKVLISDAKHLPDVTRRFIEEARAASALNHPNIATIHDLGEAEGLRFIVMEYVEGATLKQQLSTGPLDSSSIVALGCQIADALEAAHASGIIHRDIKPSNIMITPQARAKVLDFGIAKRIYAQADELTREATSAALVLGTVPYMSPEQALGHPAEAPFGHFQSWCRALRNGYGSIAVRWE